MKKILTNILALLFWLVIWQISYMYIDAKFLFASPIDVIKYIWSLLFIKDTYIMLCYTTLRIMIGFILALVCGIILGIISSVCKHVIKPIIEILMLVVKVSPIVSFIILCLVTMPSNIIVPFISFLMTLPTFYYQTVSTIKSADKNLLEMSNVYNYSLGKKIKYIYLNGNKKNILSTIESSIGFAFKSGITAEVLVLPKVSLGMILYDSKIYLDGLSLVGNTVLLILLCLLIEFIIINLVRLMMKVD